MKISIRLNPEFFEGGKDFSISDRRECVGYNTVILDSVDYDKNEVTFKLCDMGPRKVITADELATDVSINRIYAPGTPIPFKRQEPLLVKIRYEVGDFVCCAGRDYKITNATKLCDKSYFELTAVGRGAVRPQDRFTFKMYVTVDMLLEYGEPLEEFTSYKPKYLNGYMRNDRCYQWDDEEEEFE